MLRIPQRENELDNCVRTEPFFSLALSTASSSRPFENQFVCLKYATTTDKDEGIKKKNRGDKNKMLHMIIKNHKKVLFVIFARSFILISIKEIVCENFGRSFLMAFLTLH